MRIDGTGSTQGLYFNSTVSHILLDNVASVENNYGLNVTNSGVVTDLKLDNVALTDNTTGFRVGSTGKVTHLILQNGHIDGNDYGLYNEADSASANETAFTDISVTGTTFDDNTIKGIYLEKLDHAIFSGISVDNSGTVPASNANGIDLNLKYSDYSEITLQNFSVTNSGNVASSTAVTIKGAVRSAIRRTVPSRPPSPACI